ncbi:MAG: dehydrogenase [Solirubrobacterales bacterium]|nr:dehydrogenase [Solirubrobacterales bacterium]
MTTPRLQTVAVLGAGGRMGLPMTRNLARAGLTVRAWNRTPEKADPLREDGVRVCASAAEAADGADVVLSMLSDADAVLAAVREDGVLDGPSVWLQMSTIGVAGTDACTALARERGIAFVDAPVLGTVQPAEAGTLVVLGSGPQAQREPLAPLLDAVGGRTLWTGEAGAGSRLKLVANAWLLAIVEGAAEALALAEGLELDGALLLEAVGGGPLDVPYLQSKGRGMLDREFAPAFTLAMAAKDAGLVDDAAGMAGLRLPMLRAIRERFDEGAQTHGERDLSATFLTSAPSPGSP